MSRTRAHRPYKFLPVAEKGVHHEREREDKGEDRAGDRLVALRDGAPQQIGLVGLHEKYLREIGNSGNQE